MGFLNCLTIEEKQDIDNYIERHFGTCYITQEDRERLLYSYVKESSETVEKRNETSDAEPGIRYSLPSDDDIYRLSLQADDYLNSEYDPVSFRDYLLDLINKSGLNNVEIYKRANLSKSLFSSLLSKGHIPKKGTIVALAIALELNLKETESLLMKAGYTFSNLIKGDLIAVYFISHGIYDIDKLNSALYDHGEPVLGSKSY